MSPAAHDVPADHVDVANVGGGPAGLTAATALRHAGAGSVVVLEREHETGGIPRHARHQGFGIRDLHRIMSGPDYAARLTERACNAGAELRISTQATGWTSDGAIETTSPSGRRRLRARAVVLATGCRERPRAARFVAGSRPQGVMTTSMLQQLVYLLGEAPGRRAVVVGAEHVSFSSLLTLEHGGAKATAMVTSQAHHQSFAAFRAGAALRFRTPLLTRTAVTEIHGRRRVEAVTVKDLDTGDLLHGAETADVAALSGHHVTEGVVAHLEGQPWPRPPIPIRCADPLHWIAPNAVTAPQAPSRGRFLLRARRELIWPWIEITQDRRRLWSGRLPRVMPGRSAAFGTRWMTSVDPAAGTVTVSVLRARRRHCPRRRRRAATGAPSSR